MNGTLQKIDIDGELVEHVARAQFDDCNDVSWESISAYARSTWINGAHDALDDFNMLVEIFESMKIQCAVEVYGCGHDVDEFYRE